jgi:histidinol-phosphate aminotransferase
MQVVDSWANFVMIPLDSAEGADAFVEALLRQGIIIRPLKAFGLPHCVRISVGTGEANELCVRAAETAAAQPR